MKPREVHHLHAHAPTDEEITSWIGAPVSDELGKSVGKIEDVFRVNGKLEWLLIRHRRSHHFLAPVKDAVGDPHKVVLLHEFDHIESAPETKPGETADEDTIAAAKAHYGMS